MSDYMVLLMAGLFLIALCVATYLVTGQKQSTDKGSKQGEFKFPEPEPKVEQPNREMAEVGH